MHVKTREAGSGGSSKKQLAHTRAHASDDSHSFACQQPPMPGPPTPPDPKHKFPEQGHPTARLSHQARKEGRRRVPAWSPAHRPYQAVTLTLRLQGHTPAPPRVLQTMLCGEHTKQQGDKASSRVSPAPSPASCKAASRQWNFSYNKPWQKCLESIAGKAEVCA